MNLLPLNFSGSTRISKFRIPIVFCLAAFGLSGCQTGNVAYTLDPSFSLNIADVNPDWPTDVDLLHPFERETFEQRGRPDFIHVIWSKRHDIVNKSDVARFSRNPKRNKQLAQGWIYVDDDEEVVFSLGEDPPKVRPLLDKLEVISRMGDPNPMNTKTFPNSSGMRIETWHYVGQGVIFTFSDGILIKEDRSSVPPMPGYMGR